MKLIQISGWLSLVVHLGVRTRLELRFLLLNPVFSSVPWLNHQRIPCLNKLNNLLCPLLLKLSTKKKKYKMWQLFTSGFIPLWEHLDLSTVAPCQWQMEALRLPSHHPLPFMVSRDFLLSFVTQLQSSCCWEAPAFPLSQGSFPKHPHGV